MVGFRTQAVQGSELIEIDNSPVVLKRGQNIVGKRTGGHQPLKFLSSHPRVPDDGRDRWRLPGSPAATATVNPGNLAAGSHCWPLWDGKIATGGLALPCAFDMLAGPGNDGKVY
jgi:hypothetical protein